MIIIDKPYVSDHVVQTILKNKFKVLRNHVSESILNGYPELLLNEGIVLELSTPPRVRLERGERGSFR